MQSQPHCSGIPLNPGPGEHYRFRSAAISAWASANCGGDVLNVALELLLRAILACSVAKGAILPGT